jgi:hypothetical protein
MTTPSALWGALRSALSSRLWERDLLAWDEISREAWFLAEGAPAYMLDWADRNPLPDYARRVLPSDLNPARLERWGEEFFREGRHRNGSLPSLQGVGSRSRAELLDLDPEVAWLWGWTREVDFSDEELRARLFAAAELWKDFVRRAPHGSSARPSFEAPWTSACFCNRADPGREPFLMDGFWGRNLAEYSQNSRLMSFPNLRRVIVGEAIVQPATRDEEGYPQGPDVHLVNLVNWGIDLEEWDPAWRRKTVPERAPLKVEVYVDCSREDLTSLSPAAWMQGKGRAFLNPGFAGGGGIGWIKTEVLFLMTGPDLARARTFHAHAGLPPDRSGLVATYASRVLRPEDVLRGGYARP